MATTTAGRIWERFYYDCSLYKAFFEPRGVPYQKYVVGRHVGLIVGGFFVLLHGMAMPMNPPFPTMGMCPPGYQGTFVCEPDKRKAMEMYLEWKKTGKLHPPAGKAAEAALPAAAAAAAH